MTAGSKCCGCASGGGRGSKLGVYRGTPSTCEGDEAFVDFNRAVRVEEVREAWFVVEEQEGRRRRRRRARAPPREALFVAVRFTSENGTVPWTLSSKGDTQVMDVVEDPLFV